ncbi:hypothetical protein NQZ68_013767 [Dissostichus eleginoides]|nr:hypothetical protein NQZ68_013767 [Dissostichus eleginoides]
MDSTPVVSGTKTLAANPLSPVIYEGGRHLITPYGPAATAWRIIMLKEATAIRTSITCFSNWSYSRSSVGSHHTGKPLLPMRINEPSPPMTLSPVQ